MGFANRLSLPAGSSTMCRLWFWHWAIINLFNGIGTFANDTNLTTETQLLHLVVLIVITVTYTLILIRTLPKKQWEHTNVDS